MKRLFKVLLASVLCLCLFVVVSPFTVFAADETGIKAKLSESGLFDDDAFIGLIAKSLSDAGLTDDTLYESVDAIKSTLAGFNGKIDAPANNVTSIKSIKGIDLLTGATAIILDHNKISDITPITKLDGVYRGYFSIQYNPINRFFSSIDDQLYVFRTYSTQMSAFENGQKFGTDLNVLYSGKDLGIKLYFGATVNDKYEWNHSKTDGSVIYPYLFEPKDTDKVAIVYDGSSPATEDYCTVTVKDNIDFCVRAYFQNYRFYTQWVGGTAYEEEPDSYGDVKELSPSCYDYFQVHKYIPLKQSTTTKVLGGIKVEKKDAAGNLLDGAVFALYKDAELKEKIAEGKTENGVVVFSELEAGDYYLNEESAPSGYMVDDEKYDWPMKVTVDGGVEAGSEFSGGTKTIKNVYSGELSFAPDWDKWVDSEDPFYRQTMKLVSGSVEDEITADSDPDVMTYLTEGGEKINSFKNEFSAEDLNKVTVKESSLVLTIGGKKINVSSYEEARELVNAAIEDGSINDADEVSLDGSITYAAQEDAYANVEVTNKSLCVYLEPIANKKLVGRAIKEGEFGFEITKCDEEGNEVGLFSGVNAAAEADEDYTVVNFVDEKGDPAVLKFCKVGLYEFKLREVVTDREEGMVYDETDRAVSVVVTESGSKGLMAEVYVDGKLVATVYSADTTKADNTVLDAGTVELATIVNRCTERANPSTGVPTMFSLVKILTAAGLGIVLKKKFF